MTAPHRTDTRERSEPAPRRADLNWAKISGTALAAVTAAVLGSRLGVAGTVSGAALASVVTTVSSTWYQSSLERSSERIRVRTGRPAPVPTQRPPSRWEDAPTVRIDRSGFGTPRARRQKPHWAMLGIGALIAFVLSMMLITGYEMARGESLSGDSGGPSVAQFTADASADASHDPPVETSTPESPPPATTAPPSPGPDTETPAPDVADDPENSQTTGTGDDGVSPEDRDTDPPTGEPEEPGLIPRLLGP